jgi:hypothetical protein
MWRQSCGHVLANKGHRRTDDSAMPLLDHEHSDVYRPEPNKI